MSRERDIMVAMGKRRCGASAISVIEAAYAVHRPEQAWLEGLVNAAEPEIAEGFGVWSYVYDASRAPIRLGSFVAHSAATAGVDIVRSVVENADEDYIARTWRALSFAT